MVAVEVAVNTGTLKLELESDPITTADGLPVACCTVPVDDVLLAGRSFAAD